MGLLQFGGTDHIGTSVAQAPQRLLRSGRGGRSGRAPSRATRSRRDTRADGRARGDAQALPAGHPTAPPGLAEPVLHSFHSPAFTRQLWTSSSSSRLWFRRSGQCPSPASVRSTSWGTGWLLEDHPRCGARALGQLLPGVVECPSPSSRPSPASDRTDQLVPIRFRMRRKSTCRTPTSDECGTLWAFHSPARPGPAPVGPEHAETSRATRLAAPSASGRVGSSVGGQVIRSSVCAAGVVGTASEGRVTVA